MIDDVIMEKLKANDEQGLILLMDQYCHYVTSIVCNLSQGQLTTGDVEEISADVLIAIWNNRDTLRPQGSLKPYLAQIARNATISRLRKLKGKTLPLDDSLLLQVSANDLEDLLLQKEEEALINQAIESFGEIEREIFVRYYFFGEHIKTIAQRLHLNTNTIKTKLRRSRKKLQSIFETRGYSHEKANQHQ